jgi:hypothetical protein
MGIAVEKAKHFCLDYRYAPYGDGEFDVMRCAGEGIIEVGVD